MNDTISAPIDEIDGSIDRSVSPHASSYVEADPVRTTNLPTESESSAARAAQAEADDRWVIRKVPQIERDGALASAKRRRVTMGEWIAGAIRRELEAERESMEGRGRVGEVLPPGRTEQLLPVVRDEGTLHHLLSIEDIDRAVDVACKLARACGQDKPPRAFVKQVQRVLSERLDGPRSP